MERKLSSLENSLNFIKLIEERETDETLIDSYLKLSREELSFNELDDFGLGAIHYICEQGNEKLLQKLIELKKLEINLQGEGKETVIQIIWQRKKKLIFEILLQNRVCI